MVGAKGLATLRETLIIITLIATRLLFLLYVQVFMELSASEALVS
jgi:hypothetical protein